MKQSKLYTTTRKEAPKDETSKNAQLLIKAGYIHKQMAGAYAYLPLGLRVLSNINTIIRDEMNNIGGEELLLTALQEKSLWEKTDRWDDKKNDAWFKSLLKNKTEVGLGITHEEPIANTLKEYITSYKQLPAYPYQIQLKFRNETRAKSGIMRTREFLMKDLYSLSKNQSEHDDFYKRAKEAYMKIFDRVSIAKRTYETFASGGIFAEFSHEFQTVCDAGEDTIFIDENKNLAINKEVYSDKVIKKLGLIKNQLVEKKSIEVGNIFTLGSRFSEPLGFTYKNESGKDTPVFMGSYGIGPGRLMGTVVELLSDDKGIVWPKEITPFNVHVITLGTDDEIMRRAEIAYKKIKDTEINNKKVTVLWDDRDESPGKKLKDSDLIGIPLQVIIGSKSNKNECGFKERSSAKQDDIISIKEGIERIKKYYA